jgi:uncharacterized protein YybS (DUF2232 family)
MVQGGQTQMAKEVAAGVAITTAMVAVAAFMPIIGFFCALFIPLPPLFFRVRLGRQIGMIVPLSVLLIIGIVLGQLSSDILLFAQLLLLGTVLGELFEKKLSVERTALLAAGAVLATGAVAMVIYSAAVNQGVGTLISNYVKQNLELTLALYKQMGVSEAHIHMISDSLDQIRFVLVSILPALFTVSMLFVTWITILMAGRLFRKRGLPYPDFGPLNRWKAPEFLVWGVIVSGLLLLIPDGLSKILGLNMLIVFLLVYFFEGIAIVSFYFEKKRFPGALKIFLYSLIALQQVILLVVIGIGFFDVWVNFRKLGTENGD